MNKYNKKRVCPKRERVLINHGKVIFVLFLVLGSISQSLGQLVIDDTKTPEELLRTILLGEGVEVSNVVFAGDAQQFAGFENSDSKLGFTSGMMITTGRSQVALTNTDWPGAPGSDFNTRGDTHDTDFEGPGDADLTDIIDQETRDAAFIEFDFVPANDKLEFRYVFASEEYPDFSCAPYSDAFAFLLEGPGFREKTNIALVPGSTIPVSINSINNGRANMDFAGWEDRCAPPLGSLRNERLYVDNDEGKWIEFDGMTVTLTATATVVPCQSYRIKLVIADAVDSQFDSGVFLEAKSFDSQTFVVETVSPTDSTRIIEGCGAASVNLTFDEKFEVATPLDFRISGTATEGVDYEPIPDEIVVAAGDSIVMIDVVPLPDGVADNLETIIFEFRDNGCNRYDTLIVEINDPGSMAVVEDSFFICSGVDNVIPFETEITLGDSIGLWQWIASDGTIVDSVASPVLNIVQPDTYEVVFTQGSCIQRDTIHVIAANDIVFKPNQRIDKCDAVPITADVIESGDRAGLRYDVYDRADNLICDDCSEVIFTNTTTDTFTVIGQNEFGCIDTIVLDVVVEPRPIITNLTCIDETHSSFGISWDVTNAVGEYGIRLDGGAEQFFDVGEPISFDGFTPGSGQIINLVMIAYPSAGEGCILSEPVELSCQLLACADYNWAFNMDTISCNEKPIILSTTIPFATYEWTAGVDSGSDTEFTVSTTSDVQVIVKDEFGCAETMTQRFHIVDSLLLEVAKSDISCNDLTDGELSVAIEGGNSSLYNIEWSNGDLTNNQAGLATGKYSVTVSDDQGCLATDSTVINLPDPLDFKVNLIDPQGFEIRIIEGCSNAEVTIDIGTPQIRDVELVIRVSGTATEGTDYSSIPDGFTVPAGDSIVSFIIQPTKDATVEGLEDIIIEARRSTCAIFDTLIMEINDEGALELEQDTLEICLGVESMFEAAAIIPRGESSGAFLWTPMDGLSDRTIRNPVVDVTGIPTQYIVRFEQDQCVQNATFRIIANHEIELQKDTSLIKCDNIDIGIDLFNSGDNIGLQYDILDSNNNIICDDCHVVSFNNMEDQSFQVIGTNQFGCQDSVDLQVNTEQQIELTNVSCINETHSSFELDWDANTDVERYGITVKGEEKFFNSGEPIILDGFSTGPGETIEVEMIAYPGLDTKCLPTVSTNLSCKLLACTDYDIQFEQELVSCNNDPIILNTVSTFEKYQWTSNSRNGADDKFTVREKGMTKVIVEDEFGCIDSFEEFVNIVDTIELELTVQDLFCFGDEDGSVALNIDGGNGSEFSVNWSNGAIANTNMNLSADDYSVTVTDDVGCQTVDRVTVREPDPIDIMLEMDEPTCFGYSDGGINIVPLGGTEPFDYSLNGAERVSSTNIRGMAAQEHVLNIRDARGCEFDSIFTLSQPEQFIVELDENLSTNYLSRASFRASVINPQGDVNYIWTGSFVNELSCLDCPNPSFIALSSGNYLVEAIDEAGCHSQDLIRLTVSTDRTISVPSGFTPNDDGVNDVLEVFGARGTQIESFKIYDRFGEEVYVRNDFEINNIPGMGWDGTFRGSPLNSGTFVWSVEVVFIDGLEKSFSGTTVLIR